MLLPMSDLLRNACTFSFVPATQPERLHKALASQADMVIADWEDAVAPADKAQAREALLVAVQTLSAAQRARLLVRINAAGTAWFDGDVQALARLVAQGVAGAVVPKSESPAQLVVIGEQAGAACALVALVETVAGIDASRCLGACATGAALGVWPSGFSSGCRYAMRVPMRPNCCPFAWPWSWLRAGLALASRWMA